ISAHPGIFREQTYAAPVSPALTSPPVEVMTRSGSNAEYDQRDHSLTQNAAAAQASADDKRKSAFFAKSQGVRARGILPIRVSFPAFGPSVFLTAQLSSAGQEPNAIFDYQKDKKGGR